MLLVAFTPPCIRWRYRSLNAASATQILAKAFSADIWGIENCLIGDALLDPGFGPEDKFGVNYTNLLQLNPYKEHSYETFD